MAVKTKAKKNKGGRPSLLDLMDYARMRRLAELGMTDKQIAYVVGVSVVTLNAWKKNKRFLKSLKKGKNIADSQVEESLFHRALGYTHVEEQIFQYQGKIIRTETLKHYAPDPTSMIFWLKNRQADKWREKKNGENGHHITNIINNIVTSGGKADKEHERRRVSECLGVVEEELYSRQSVPTD